MAFNTFLNTFGVVAAGANIAPTTLLKGNRGAPMRVELRNVGATLIFIGISPGDVGGNSGPVTATYRIPSGATDVFVVLPEQALYAVSAGQGGLISVATSEAIPISPVR